MRLSALATFTALALALAACGGSSSNSSPKKVGGAISGAGATFPEPLYDEWVKRFKDETGTTVTYDPIGSGGGIAQFIAKTADFGASDAPMTAAEVRAAEKKGAPVHVPTVFGAVTVSYNVPALAKGLRLDGATVADIFLGRIRRWNDGRIAALNPGTKLPNIAITVVHRADESGTTKVFTTFLAGTSPEWARRVGSDKSVRWPVGVGAAKNTGVAAGVRATNGAVGYVEQAYALQNNLTTATVRNRAGRYVAPTLESTIAAGQGVTVPRDLRFSAVGTSTDPGAYPIATATFLLVYRDMCKAGLPPDRAQRVVNWLHYALTAGQRVAPELQYAPLPNAVLAPARRAVAAEKCDGRLLKAGSGA
jgi:phosphate transport system substrate-binding protein